MTGISTEQDAEAFLRTWLEMLDTGAPPPQFLRHLPDGDFEEWSYPEAEIRNVEHLMQFFQQAWGAIKKNTNTVRAISAKAVDDGRFQVDADVDWEGLTGDDQTIKSSLHYRLTVGSGSSSHDPDGAHAKIFRYKIIRE